MKSKRWHARAKGRAALPKPQPQPAPPSNRVHHVIPGGLYQIHHEIVRMKDRDSSDRPRFEVVGYASLPEDCHLIDWKLTGNHDRFHGHPLFLRAGDPTVWEGEGVLFKTPKAAQMQKLVGLRLELGVQYFGVKDKPNTPKWRAVKKKLKAWQQQAEQLFATRASTDPKWQPTPEAKPTVVSLPAAVRTPATKRKPGLESDLWENL